MQKLINILVVILITVLNACAGAPEHVETATVCELANLKDNNDVTRIKSVLSDYPIDIDLVRREVTIKQSKQISLEEIERKIKPAGFRIIRCWHISINIEPK